MTARRRAAARVLLAGFGMCNTLANSLLRFDEANDGWGDTFTPKEKEHLTLIKQRIHDNGELLRKLAWRMQRT